jgi:DNA-binding NarL/FixJ family response regulator
MALSYKDIGSILGKSANTIKNQMHQILIKADLFERAIDNDMRNRFRLKDGIKIEKYLNIDRPSDQPTVPERLS